MSFHQFTDADGSTYGSFELFYANFQFGNPEGKGWYWQACFPGCLPDGDPSGPFSSEQEAIKDATPYV